MSTLSQFHSSSNQNWRDTGDNVCLDDLHNCSYFIFIDNLFIVPLISPRDMSTPTDWLMLKIIGQCNVTSSTLWLAGKTITSVVKVWRYIITDIAAIPIGHAAILMVLSVPAFITFVILYIPTIYKFFRWSCYVILSVAIIYRTKQK